MRFLIDNNLSIKLTEGLQALGHDAVHARERGLSEAPDLRVLAAAALEERIVISADRDFGTLLAQLTATQPSVVYLRGRVTRQPAELAALLHANLSPLEQRLSDGAIVVVEPGRIRIRSLPIG